MIAAAQFPSLNTEGKPAVVTVCAVLQLAYVESGGTACGISREGHVLSRVKSLVYGTVELTAQFDAIRAA